MSATAAHERAARPWGAGLRQRARTTLTPPAFDTPLASAPSSIVDPDIPALWTYCHSTPDFAARIRGSFPKELCHVTAAPAAAPLPSLVS